MKDVQYSVIDARLEEALEKFFDGISVRKTVGDSTILSAVRKANGARVDIYTPAYALAADDTHRAAMLKQYEAYEKLGSGRLQASVRLFKDKAFRKFPALALLACDERVIDPAFDTRDQVSRINVFVQFIKALADLHNAGIVHGGISEDCLRRETSEGAVRLCDFGFSGERPTTVTSQPSEYQSRHVLTNAQPSFVDDVHAAGMLGYRMLLGEGGPVSVLTGSATADDETVTTAILGQAGKAPTGAEILPEGHPSAEHISRLLARMTGRAGSGAPYSNAGAVLKALEAVLETPELRLSEVEPVAPPQPKVETVVVSKPATRRGVSAATAIALFVGAIGGIGGALHFYSEADRLGAAYGVAKSAAVQLTNEKGQLVSDLDAAVSTTDVLVSGASILAGAHFAGARTASNTTGQSMAEAETAFDTALAAYKTGEYEVAVEAAGQTIDAASSALSNAESAKSESLKHRAAAELGLSAAILAEGKETASIQDTSERIAKADQAFAANRFSDASEIWKAGSSSFDQIVAERRDAAERAAISAADQMPAQGSKTAATLVLGNWLMARGEDAFANGRYSEAEMVYTRAAQRFGQTAAERSEMATRTKPATTGATGKPSTPYPSSVDAEAIPAQPKTQNVDLSKAFAFDTINTEGDMGSAMQVAMNTVETYCTAAGGSIQLIAAPSATNENAVHVHCELEKESW